jgi:hypothetical protein
MPGRVARIKMKHLFVISLLFCCSYNSLSQTINYNEFEKVAQDVILKLSTKDSIGIQIYINRKAGLFVLYRGGIKNNYKHFDTLDFGYKRFFNFKPFKPSKLQYSTLPTFSCDTEKWTKSGRIVDTTRTDHLLSITAKNLTRIFKESVPQETITNFINLEAKSRRIVVVDNYGNSIVFYLSFINNKWWLTIIDAITEDCSA